MTTLYIIIALCAAVFLIGFGYAWGHNTCWIKWDAWTRNEPLSEKCRKRIAGIEP